MTDRADVQPHTEPVGQTVLFPDEWKRPAWLADLDEGIRYAVEVLDHEGVETYESCQGGSSHAYAEPSVRFYGGDGAGWAALSVALNYGLPIQSLSRIWTFDRSSDSVPHGPHWQMTFYEKIVDPRPEPRPYEPYLVDAPNHRPPLLMRPAGSVWGEVTTDQTLQTHTRAELGDS